MSEFPVFRGRRLRKPALLRNMVRETDLRPQNLVYPVFVVSGSGVDKPVGSMPGVSQWSVDRFAEEASRLVDEGVASVILFGIPETKDAVGSSSWDPNGVIPQALAAARKSAPDLVAMVDLCFCEYTDHGHCGIMKDGELDNDATRENLGRQARVLAEAGAHVIAPSGMVDGMVSSIRGALDMAGFPELPVLSYAAKYASAYYGPFRDAAESAPAYGDRRTHQMDPGNVLEALREVAVDLEEGADMVMVKPALPYLDVIRRVREAFPVPVAAYQVSGEYSQIKAAGEKGWIDEERVMMESLCSIRRAGADLVLTYFAREAARRLRAGWQF